MTPSEYIDVRLKNGKICDGFRMENGKRVRTEPNSKSLPEDMRYIERYGRTMRDFWDNATSQKDLLWALRGLGRDRTANLIWRALALKYDLVLHKTVFTKELSKTLADEIRDNFECPQEFCE